MEAKLWMALQGDTQRQNLEVPTTTTMLERINNLYSQINLALNVLHVVLHIKLGSVLLHCLFASNVTNKAIFPGYVDMLPQVNPILIGIRGDFVW